MWASRAASGAHVADDLALAHARTLLAALGVVGKVGVLAFVTVAVLDGYQLAEGSVARGPSHHAVRGRDHWRAGGRGVVRALVSADGIEDGVAPGQAEVAAETGEVDGIAKKGLAHALAFG